MTPIRTPTEAAIAEAVQVLRRGGLVGLPTETVYGLAARALDPDAVARIFAAKARPRLNPLIVHLATPDLAAVDGRVVDRSALGPRGRAAVRALTQVWPGPLTLVLPRGAAIPDLVTAGLPTVAVRCPDHPVARAVIERAGPLAAPSANRSGRISPTTAAHVAAELGPAVALVLDGGPCRVGLESTVVHVGPDGTATLLRPGAVTLETLTAHLGHPPRLRPPESAPDAPASPGLLLRHYAPRTPFLALPGPLDALPDPARADLLAGIGPTRGRVPRIGLLQWTPRAVRWPGVMLHPTPLTRTGDPAEAARALFATLRALDALEADLLLAEPCPPPGYGDEGLSHALRDRLSRATRPLEENP